MTAKISDEQLAHWEEICRNATERPWICRSKPSAIELDSVASPHMQVTTMHKHEGDNSQLLIDAQFIAEARTALPALLEAYKEAREIVARQAVAIVTQIARIKEDKKKIAKLEATNGNES